MSLVWKKVARFGFPEVLALISALSFFAARFLPLLASPYRCPFRLLFGIPCMTCGMTHAFVHLAHGQVRDALAANPFGALLAAAVWLFAVADLSRAAVGAPFPELSGRGLRAVVATGFLALTVNWTYLLVRSLS
jgi:hypothetical protein